jgi:hypothetical protein
MREKRWESAEWRMLSSAPTYADLLPRQGSAHAPAPALRNDWQSFRVGSRRHSVTPNQSNTGRIRGSERHYYPYQNFARIMARISSQSRRGGSMGAA